MIGVVSIILCLVVLCLIQIWRRENLIEINPDYKRDKKKGPDFDERALFKSEDCCKGQERDYKLGVMEELREQKTFNGCGLMSKMEETERLSYGSEETSII